MDPAWKGGEPVVADLLQRGLEELGAEVLREGSRRSFSELFALSMIPYDAEPMRFAHYRRRLRILRPDAVLVFYDFDCSLVLAARNLGIPVVVCVQIYWPTCPIGTHYIEGVGVCATPELAKCLRHISEAPPSPNLALPVPGLPAPLGLVLYAKLKTRHPALSQADALVANSPFMQGVLERAGYRKVHLIPNGVDTEQFHSAPWAETTKRVLYPVARSKQERKGYPHFVQMARAVRSQFPDVRFRILNDPGDDLMEGTPYLTHPELAKELAATYLAVIPGLWDEPFGLVAPEAMAAGRPVVAYRAGGLTDIIEDGVSGLLVPRGNVEELTQAVVGLLNDEGKARRMGERARERVVSQFRYQLMAQRYFDLIQSLVNEAS
jgi:glycosyltransferase involved in cell wall biosynthesis